MTPAGSILTPDQDASTLGVTASGTNTASSAVSNPVGVSVVQAIVPTDMFGVPVKPAALPVQLPELPDVLPVTSPVKSPTKAVEVIDVAPVTTPASTTIVPSRTICCPVSGVIVKSVPAVEEISLPFIVILSTERVVRVPKEVIEGCAAVVTVAAVPDVLPVTLPVIFPTKVPVIVPAFKSS